MPDDLQIDDGRGVTLRPTVAEDEGFLQAVYDSTRAGELAHVPWTDDQRSAFLRMQFAAQTRHYVSHFPGAEHNVILVSGNPAGRIYVDRRKSEIRILDMALLPEHRGRGIGSSILKPLIAEAAETGKSLTIYVENFNPSRRLFERLGFRQQAEDGLNILLEWKK